jgi:hypothetical protein
MRRISIQLTILANEYETKRKAFSKKSSWAKTLCLIKCIPEPISEVEYNSTIVHCSDYYISVEKSDSDTTRVVSIAGSKIVNPLLENSFSKI